MGSLLDFIGGVADHYDKEAERKRQQEEADADMERQYKLTTRLEEFRDKLQEERLKRTPKETRINKGMVEILNGNGEVIGSREATERELQADQLNSQKLQGELVDTSPQVRQQARDMERRKAESEIGYRGALTAQASENAKTERYNRARQTAEDNIPLPPGVQPGAGRGLLGRGSQPDPYKRVNELSDNYLQMLGDRETPPEIKAEIAKAQSAISAAGGNPQVIAELEAALAQRIAELSGL